MGRTIGFANFLNTVNSFFKNEATAPRTYTFPDRSGEIPLVFTETATAHVDASGSDVTGTVGRKDLPFATITAALAAGTGVTYLKIKVGIGTFASPVQANLRSNLWLEGSGRPGYNWVQSQTSTATFSTTDPTSLIGGTILQGQVYFLDRSNVHITDLGVDGGSAFVTGGGTESNQLVFISATASAPFPMMTNIVIRNVITLGRTASSAFHGIQLENCYKPVVDNVETYFSTHGVVSKNYGGIFSNIKAHYHTSNGIIIKADTYAFSNQTIVDGFEIRGGGGFRIDIGASATVGSNTMMVSNGLISGVTFGVQLKSQVAATSNYTNFNNVKVIGVSSGTGFDIAATQSVMMSNCIALGCTTGFVGVATSTNTFHHYHNCHAEGCTTGFNITASSSSTFLRNCSMRSCSGTGLAATGTVYAVGLSFDNNGANTSGTILNYQTGRNYFGGVASPTALIHLAAGTATASTAPLKLTAGTNLGTPENGAFEFDGTNLYFTSGGTRKTITMV